MKFWPLAPQQSNSTPESPTGNRELPTAFAERLFGKAAAASKNQRRDIVLWDMGGQEEYRLIHQLFLHDTTVALVLLDPTRGATAIKEVETWNKSLEKQLRGRTAVKLLVGAKVDRPSDMIDRRELERLCHDCGFADYCETSAINGRGVAELCEAMAKAIDWDSLGKTTRPELFQAIRDEIESRRKKGVVVNGV
jgi:GTPase SAR1 family protein